MLFVSLLFRDYLVTNLAFIKLRVQFRMETHSVLPQRRSQTVAFPADVALKRHIPRVLIHVKLKFLFAVKTSQTFAACEFVLFEMPFLVVFNAEPPGRFITANLANIQGQGMIPPFVLQIRFESFESSLAFFTRDRFVVTAENMQTILGFFFKKIGAIVAFESCFTP